MLKIIRDYYKQLYVNLEEMSKLWERYNLQRLNQRNIWKFNQCDTPCNQIKKWKQNGHLSRCLKIFWRHSTAIHDKSSTEVNIEEAYLNIIKAIYDKLTASIILMDEKLKAFPLRSGWRQGRPLSHYYSTQFWKSQLQGSEKINK